MLAPHIAQTLRRMEQLPVVLAIQDTTEFNLTHLHATQGLGDGTGGYERGFMMHSLLAVSPEGLPLGVLGMKTWARTEAAKGSAARSELNRIEKLWHTMKYEWLAFKARDRQTLETDVDTILREFGSNYRFTFC